MQTNQIRLKENYHHMKEKDSILNNKIMLQLISCLAAIVIAGCHSTEKRSATNPALSQQSISPKDTIINIFQDSAFELNFRQSPEKEGFVILSLTKNENSKRNIIRSDTLQVYEPKLFLKDFNNDKNKDVQILSGIGYLGSSKEKQNSVYFLYLVDEKTHTLKKVESFEDVFNPEYDSINDIVISKRKGVILDVHKINELTNHYEFYRINKTGELIDLRNSFYDDGKLADKKYLQAVKKIKLQQG